MHELSIANTILTTVLSEVERQNLPPVTAVGLRLGAMSDIVPDSLTFNFDVIKADTPLAGAELEIEVVPLHAACLACKHEFPVEDLVFACPACESGSIRVEQGQEIDITHLSVEDEA